MRARQLFPRLTAHVCAALLLLSSAPGNGVADARQRRRGRTRPRAAAPAPRATPVAPLPGATPATPTTTAPATTNTTTATPAPNAANARAQQPAARRSEPDLSFEEMLAADAYTVYAELRRVGTLSRAEEVKTAVASLRLLGGEEVRPLTDFYDFVAGNAEALGESRIVFCFMPASKGVPQGVLAFELESPEAAVAFEPKLRRILGEQVRMVRKAMDEQPAHPGAPRIQKPPPPKKVPGSDFAIRRAGRWLVTSDGPFKLKQLRAAEGEPSLADSTRFQTVRSRFANASLFVYVDTDVAQRAWALQMQTIEESSHEVAGVEASDSSLPTAVIVAEGKVPAPPGADATPEPTAEPSPEPTAEPTPEEGGGTLSVAAVDAEGEGEGEREAPPPEPTAEDRAVRGLSRIMQNLGFGVPRIPGALALGVGLDRGALAFRLAVENTPDGTIALIPFLPNIVSGPPVTGGTAEVAPADSELFVAGSLDWTHIYNSTLGAASVNPAGLMAAAGMGGEGDEGGGGKSEPQPTADETVAAVEKLFGFKFKEDLLPSLGNEVALSMPLDASDFPLSGVRRRVEEGGREEPDAVPGPVFIASLNDPAKMREILPRVFVAFGFVAPGVPQVPEKREGVEIRTLGASDGISYAVVDSFLLVGELRAVRHCVDSYSSRRTLAASNDYRDATSWQAKQKLVQLFVSDSVVRRLVDDARTRSAGSTDAVVRALLAQLETAEYAPASYEATNEGDVVVHELRLPLSLIKSYATAVAVGVRDATVINGESSTVQTLNHLAVAEHGFKHEKKKERFGTLEELRAEGLVEKDFLTGETEYKYEVNASADKFEITATPRNYGKTGRRSFVIDENFNVRGADHKGERATSDDPKVGP